MRARAKRWAEGLRIKNGPWRVLQALVGYMHPETGACFPSLKTLAKDTGLAKSTVRAGLRDLEAHGLISTEPRRTEGRQSSNDYHLHVGAKPKPIGKRPDTLRKAKKRGAQAPETGVCEEVSRHRNTAAEQTPEIGPEYSTIRGREDGEVAGFPPGVELPDDEPTNLAVPAARRGWLDRDPFGSFPKVIQSIERGENGMPNPPPGGRRLQ